MDSRGYDAAKLAADLQQVRFTGKVVSEAMKELAAQGSAAFQVSQGTTYSIYAMLSCENGLLQLSMTAFERTSRALIPPFDYIFVTSTGENLRSQLDDGDDDGTVRSFVVVGAPERVVGGRVRLANS